MVGSDDAAQLAFANEQGRVIFTFNVADFCRLHAEYQSSGSQHAGIVVAHRRKLTLGEQVHGLARLTSTVPVETIVAQLVFLKVKDMPQLVLIDERDLESRDLVLSRSDFWTSMISTSAGRS